MPDEPDLLACGAERYVGGDVAGALQIFERAARTMAGEHRVAAMINAASMSDELGDHAAAVRWYRDALSMLPDEAIPLRPGALVNLSNSLRHLGDLEGAQEAVEQARLLLVDRADQGTLYLACLLSLTGIAMVRRQWASALDLAGESLDAAHRFAPLQAGPPLLNLALAHFETGHWELAFEFAEQALTAFEAAGNLNAVAETQQSMALMLMRVDRFDAAESLLQASQTHFERGGFAHRAGTGLKVMGFLAEQRGVLDRARELYTRSAEYFHDSGAVLDAADVQARLATVAFMSGRADEGEALLAEAFAVYAAHGLGLQCAQIDFWHAKLLEAAVDAMETPDAAVLARAVDLAVGSALTLDAVRYTLRNGSRRQQWNTMFVDPAMRLAFRFAYRSGDAQLVAELIETLCAGTTFSVSETESVPQLPLEMFDVPEHEPGAEMEALALGSALADVAASAGLPVSMPPRVAMAPDGRVALADRIFAAEQRYGRRIRGSVVLPL